MSPAPRLVPLAAIPAVAPRLAAWHAEAFGAWLGGWTVAQALAELQTHGPPGAIPFTLVALEGDEPVGSVSLLAEDPPAPAGMGPWLASLVVRPEWRGRGIGTRLHDGLVGVARSAGLPELHLWTPDAADWYAARGWTPVSRFAAHGRSSVVMRLRLSPA